MCADVRDDPQINSLKDDEEKERRGETGYIWRELYYSSIKKNQRRIEECGIFFSSSNSSAHFFIPFERIFPLIRMNGGIQMRSIFVSVLTFHTECSSNNMSFDFFSAI